MSIRLRQVLAILLVAQQLVSAKILLPDSPPVSSATAEAVRPSSNAVPVPVLAAPAAPAVDSAVLKRLADLEAYVNNTSRQDFATSKIQSAGPGHNGWVMISAALVLFMTLPGLALFFGGMVRAKNVLSVLAQCMGIAGIVTLLWWAVGYSLVFAPGNAIYGGLDYAFFRGVDAMPNPAYSNWVSHNVFAMFQLMFAIITPALLIGAAAERIKFSSMMLISVLWLFLVYIPVAHMAWGSTGLFNGLGNASAAIKAVDFAGGFAVEMASGWSALALVLILGHRKGYGKDPMPPHSMVLAMTGAGLLWVGWYGFNVGSALGADGVASNAFVATTLAAAVASILWPALEWILHGKPTVLGFCSGIVAGLVAITPAAGFVSSGAAVAIGALGTIASFFAAMRLKHLLRYDDALDTFGVHGVAGTVGTVLTGVFASVLINPNLQTNLGGLVGNGLWLEQLKAMGIVVVIALAGTTVATFATKLVLGLRPDTEDEVAGLDYLDHGEVGYRYDEA
ncbi:MAG: ammonium transporter [Fibrobacteres bacterium]|nr:ammonium transporter [Fibrobacterota bacterium]